MWVEPERGVGGSTLFLVAADLRKKEMKGP
jgi:hypothetical protein